MRKKAAIIGGSMSGLFAANFLQKINWDFTVHEMVPSTLSGRGAGIATYDELAKLETDNLFIDWYADERHNGDRNYGGLILGTLSIEKEYSQMDVSVTLTPVIRSGYYGGVNLDWEMEYHIEGYAHDDIDAIDWDGHFPNRPFMYEGWVTTFLEESADKLKTKVEKVFADYSTPLNRVGVFSNGEAIYEKA